jgi:hypothetical protein
MTPQFKTCSKQIVNIIDTSLLWNVQNIYWLQIVVLLLQQSSNHYQAWSLTNIRTTLQNSSNQYDQINQGTPFTKYC